MRRVGLQNLKAFCGLHVHSASKVQVGLRLVTAKVRVEPYRGAAPSRSSTLYGGGPGTNIRVRYYWSSYQ
eukprot:1741827-Rhodomonas_salina.3